MGGQYKVELFIAFEGAPGQRRPTSAHRRIPRSGPRVLIKIRASQARIESVYLLFRRDCEDMVLAGSPDAAVLEAVRSKLQTPELYELISVPVVWGN